MGEGRKDITDVIVWRGQERILQAKRLLYISASGCVLSHSVSQALTVQQKSRENFGSQILVVGLKKPSLSSKRYERKSSKKAESAVPSWT